MTRTYGLFILDDSNLLLSPFKTLLIVQENKYLGKLSFFFFNEIVLCVLIRIASEAILMSTFKHTIIV